MYPLQNIVVMVDVIICCCCLQLTCTTNVSLADQIGLTPEEVISKIMANPEVAMAFQNPKVQAAIMDVCSITPSCSCTVFCVHAYLTYPCILQCSQNPLSIAKYQNDKEVSFDVIMFNDDRPFIFMTLFMGDWLHHMYHLIFHCTSYMGLLYCYCTCSRNGLNI